MPTEGETQVFENVEFQSDPEAKVLSIYTRKGKDLTTFSGLSFQIEMCEDDSKEAYEMAQKAHVHHKEQMKMMLERETGPTDKFSSSFG